jgi:hypothetical protein
MTDFVRIKNYIINIEALAYVQVEKDAIAFGFSFHSEALSGQNYIRFERGTQLEDAEFEQVKEFAQDLPKLDRVIVL